MFDRLKKTAFGKWVYKFSRRPGIGWPMLMLSRFVQSEIVQPAHYYPDNRAHNRKQEQTLKQFEADHK